MSDIDEKKQYLESEFRQILLKSFLGPQIASKGHRQSEACRDWIVYEVDASRTIRDLCVEIPEAISSATATQDRVEIAYSNMTDRSIVATRWSDIYGNQSCVDKGLNLVDVLRIDAVDICSNTDLIPLSQLKNVYIVESDGDYPDLGISSFEAYGQICRVIDVNAPFFNWMAFACDCFGELLNLHSREDPNLFESDRVWSRLINGVSCIYSGGGAGDLFEKTRPGFVPEWRFRYDGIRKFVTAHEFSHLFLDEKALNILAELILKRWSVYFENNGLGVNELVNWAIELYCDIRAMKSLFSLCKNDYELLADYITGVTLMTYSLQFTEYCSPSKDLEKGFAPEYYFATHPPISIRRHWLRLIFGALHEKSRETILIQSVNSHWSSLRAAITNAPFKLPRDARRKRLDVLLDRDASMLARRLDFPFTELCFDVLDMDQMYPSVDEVLFKQLVATAEMERALKGGH